MDRLTDMQARIAEMRAMGASEDDIARTLRAAAAQMREEAADIADAAEQQAADLLVQVGVRWLNLQKSASGNEPTALATAIHGAAEIVVNTRLHRGGRAATLTLVAVDAAGDEQVLRRLELQAATGH